MEWIRENQIVWKKIGIIIGVYLGMKYLVPLVVPFLTAALVVCWCWPFLCWMRRRMRLKPPLVLAVLLLLSAAALGTGIYIAGKELGALALRLCTGTQYRGQLESFLYDCCDSVGDLLHMESAGLRVFVTDQMNIFMDRAQQNILPGAMGGSWQFLKGAGSWIAAVLVSGVSMLLLAADFEKIKEMGRRWPFYEKAVETVKGILRSVGGYLKAQAVIMGTVMLLCTLGIWISGSAASPVLAGIGTGILDALPVFGTGTVMIPWAIVELLSNNYRMMFGLLAIWLIGQLVRQVIQPKIVGDSIGMDAIPTLFLLYIGYRAAGVLGMILAVPIGIILVNLYEEGVFETTRQSLRILVAGFNQFRKIRPEDMAVVEAYERETKDIYKQEKEQGKAAAEQFHEASQLKIEEPRIIKKIIDKNKTKS